MAFKKGVSGNAKGKPKGSLNKTSAEVKNAIQSFISRNIDDLQTQYEKLDPKDKVMFFDKMLRYILQTQTKAEVEVEVKENAMDNITFVIKSKDK